MSALAGAAGARAVILWSDLGATLVHDTGAGSSFLTGSAMDILGGAVRETASSTNTLYFKFHVDPLSDVNTEEYFAAFELYEGDTERLAVGNSLKAWAYSAFNTDDTGPNNKVFGDVDLHSSTPEPASLGAPLDYEFPRRGVERTIVFKVHYVPGGKDRVTVWLNPDLSPGATEAGQPESLVTRFTANAAFDQIRLRHGGGGGGWTFSDMAIATSFSDFVASGGIESTEANHAAARGPLAFTIRTWKREEGLPQNAVHALAQTRDGYLWIGGDDGVSRFDGVRFVSFGLREGLRSLPVSVLLGDSRGALWIGSAGAGLSRFQDGRFTTFTTQDGLPDNTVTALAEDAAGRLWIGTASGLVLCENGRLTNLPAAAEFKDKPITALFKDRAGNLWVGATGVGVFEYRDGKFLQLTEASVDGLLLDPHCLLVDQAGRIWIGAGDDFVLCRDAGQWRRYRIPRHLARPYVSALAEEPDGTVWAGSVSEGLIQFRGGKLATFTASNGLSENLVESLLVDREGKLWVGTDSGLNRLRRKDLFAFGQNDGLGYGPVQGLAEVAPGLVLAAKPDDGLYRWNGRRFQRLTIEGFSEPGFQPHSLLKARDGTWWLAGSRGVLHFKDASTLAEKPESVALAGRDVISLAEDPNGGLWAGTAQGELWHRAAAGHWLAQADWPGGRAVAAIVPEPDGSVWVGTDGGGLYQFNGRVMRHLAKGGGLLSDVIRALYLDGAGTLWIGTAGGGLSRLEQGRLVTVTAREGLPDNTISQILEDSSGRLWLGSNRGIACVSKRELEDFAAGKTRAVHPRIFGVAEGMPAEQCTGGFFPAGLRTRSGLLWFSTTKGIVAADARPRASDSLAPTVMLEQVLVDGVADPAFRPTGLPAHRRLEAGVSAIEPAVLRIPPGHHRIEFRFTALSFDAPDQVRFRYRLDGLDHEWVEAESARQAPYNYVPPGRYFFHVVACNADGVWDDTGAGVGLVVMPYFWQRWWVITGSGLCLLISVAGTVRLIEKRKLHRRLLVLEQERALQRERERIARDLHDDLGSSLARISLLSGLARADKDNPAQVESHVEKISHSAAQTVRALEEIVWAVRPGSDSLQSLVEYIAHFANELFEGQRTRCRLDLPHDLPALPLPPDMRHNLFLVLKEALTNALKHAGANEVRLQARVSRGSLEFAVQDDGRGFENPATAPESSRRNGLGNMRRRAEALGGTLRIETAPGQGTTVRLVLELARLTARGAA